MLLVLLFCGGRGANSQPAAAWPVFVRLGVFPIQRMYNVSGTVLGNRGTLCVDWCNICHGERCWLSVLKCLEGSLVALL